MSDPPPMRTPKRAYQACVRCRRRKARCIIPDPAEGSHSLPSCLRCKRERKECVFTAERSRPRSMNHSVPAESITDRRQPGPEAVSHDRLNPSLWRQPSPTATLHNNRETAGQGAPATNHLPTESPLNELADRVTNTVVSNQTDALNLLFEAAEAYHTKGSISARQMPEAIAGSGVGLNPHVSHDSDPNSSESNARWMVPTYPVSQPSEEAVKAFSKLKFVRKRWLTAPEAITYIELFFKNMGPMSPATNEFYRDPSNYHLLAQQEPVLCIVILTLSTRYHVLDVDGCLSRHYFLHNRLWRYCHSLLQRVIWGQEKGIRSSTRGLGTVEGLLLMVDWHARSLHMPPDTEAWDSEDDDGPHGSETTGSSKIPNRWLEGVVEPMRRSGRMSWSLTQSAVNIGQELEVFDEDKDNAVSESAGLSESMKDFVVRRRRRLRILLYIYINQLGFRMGFLSLVPQALLAISPRAFTSTTSDQDSEWLQLMSLSADLSRLMRTASDLLFSSKATTRDLVLSGGYQRVLEHFKPMLESWWEKNSRVSVQGPLKDLFLVDFMYTKAYIYSLALQAVAERIVSYKASQGQPDALSFAIPDLSPKDYEFMQNVIDGSKEVLRMVMGFATRGKLKFLPVRGYVRIISACIFLLKALALGVPLDELNSSLDLIDQSARVLRQHIVDDVHLAGIFASLLETYTQGFRERFVTIPKVPSVSRADPQTSSLGSGILSNPAGSDDNLGSDISIQLDSSLEIDQSWLAHPFDSSIAPFGLGLTQPICGFDEELNFIWNTGL